MAPRSQDNAIAMLRVWLVAENLTAITVIIMLLPYIRSIKSCNPSMNLSVFPSNMGIGLLLYDEKSVKVQS